LASLASAHRTTASEAAFEDAPPQHICRVRVACR
jgi:hypothetical protein